MNKINIKLYETENSNNVLCKYINEAYKKCGLNISNFTKEDESKEYKACQYNLNELKIIARDAKITPTKAGQFVTFWKRKVNQPISPFDENDVIDFFVVNVKDEQKMGQFVFPKSILIKQGIISTNKKEGKRAFRVYTPWDITTSKQAIQSQKWQVEYFYEINDKIDMKMVLDLYKNDL